MTLNEGMVKHS